MQRVYGARARGFNLEKQFYCQMIDRKLIKLKNPAGGVTAGFHYLFEIIF